MKKNLLIIFSLAIVGVSSSAFVVLSDNGKAGKTGFAGEANCNDCHSASGPITTLSITSSPSFTANQYVPGQTYTINVNVSSPTLSHFGFDTEILNGTTSNSSNAGVISAISGSSQLKSNGTKTNAVHIFTAAGTGSPSAKLFMFKWVAPASGNANIFVSGIAVNNDGNENTGDATAATQSLALTPASSTGIYSLQESKTDIKLYPNPSSSNITLEYNLDTEGMLNATLYTLQGKTIKVLFNEFQTVGSQHKTAIYPEGLAEGIYILKLTQNESILSERMVIVQ